MNENSVNEKLEKLIKMVELISEKLIRIEITTEKNNLNLFNHRYYTEQRRIINRKKIIKKPH